MSSELAQAAQDLLRAQCRRHRERAIRRLEAAAAAEAEGRNPFSELLRDMAAFLDAESDDPLARELVDRARKLGVIAK